MAALVPPHITPPAQPLGRLRFMATFVRNPLRVLPRAIYEEDFVPLGRDGMRAWVTGPDLVKAVLLDQRESFGKLTQIRLLSPMLGKGILTSEGAHWKWQRQASAPMFRPQELAGFVPAFVRAATDVIERWRADPPGTIQAIDEEMTRATFEVVRSTLLRSNDPGLPLAIQSSVGALQRSGAWELLIASMNLPKWLPRPGVVRGRNAVLALRAAVAEMVRVRRAEPDEEPADLMHRLIAARDPETGQAMDDEQLVDNLLTFYLAGHETTAKALTWTLYLLSMSPEWTAALDEEIRRVTGGAPVAAEHIERLPLVLQVIKEAMRLYPPVPMMSRQAVADTQIGPHPVRAGMSILMPIYVIHRHAKRWKDPDTFDPARFDTGNESAIPRYQYMPFGAGPRICIGMSFALIEATAMVATFLQHARFTPAPGHVPVPVARVTLMPRGGMPLRVALTTTAKSFR